MAARPALRGCGRDRPRSSASSDGATSRDGGRAGRWHRRSGRSAGRRRCSARTRALRRRPAGSSPGRSRARARRPRRDCRRCARNRRSSRACTGRRRRPASRKRRKAAPTSRRIASGPSERAMPAMPTTSCSRAFAANSSALRMVEEHEGLEPMAVELRHVLGCAGEVVAVKGEQRARSRFPAGRHRITPVTPARNHERPLLRHLPDRDRHRPCRGRGGDRGRGLDRDLRQAHRRRRPSASSACMRRGSSASPSSTRARSRACRCARPTQGRFRRAEVTISWPLANTGPSIPNILAAVAGNLFECREVTGLRLLDLDLPAALLGPYQGPQFGIAGTRALAGVRRHALSSAPSSSRASG